MFLSFLFLVFSLLVRSSLYFSIANKLKWFRIGIILRNWCLFIVVSDTDSLAEKFECKLCGKVYQWKQSLKRHIREDRCDKGPQHACPRCGMSFKHTSRLNKHVVLCPHIVFDDNPAAAASTSASSSSTVQRILKLPPPCPDAVPITAAVSTATTATSSSSSSPSSQTILVLHLKNQSLAQNWNSKIQKLGN